MSTLEVSALRKGYGDDPVLRGVDLVVASGSLTAVLGSSGCGKTTLLRLVAGFDPPDAGTITLGGTVLASPGTMVPARQRRIGYVAQEGALFPHLDVAGNIGFALPRRDRRIGAAVAHLMEVVGLERALASRLPTQLSGGQQQRVAIARALAPRPGLVLLDEPFSALDAGLRAETRGAVVRACRESGATALLVTHDQDEALSTADQLAVLNDGTLKQVGPPAEVYRSPADAATATFLGAAMLVPCVVEGDTARSDVLGPLRVLTRRRPGAALAVVRPEDLTIGSEGVPARVVGTDFHGAHAEVHLSVDRSVTPMRTRVPGNRVPPIGTVVQVRVIGPVSCVDDPGCDQRAPST